MVSVCGPSASAAEEIRNAAAVSGRITECLRNCPLPVHVYGHIHRLTGPEKDSGGDGVEHDPHWDPLCNLHEVSGRVVGREERKAGAGAGSEALHPTVNC